MTELLIRAAAFSRLAYVVNTVNRSPESTLHNNSILYFILKDLDEGRTAPTFPTKDMEAMAAAILLVIRHYSPEVHAKINTLYLAKLGCSIMNYNEEEERANLRAQEINELNNEFYKIYKELQGKVDVQPSARLIYYKKNHGFHPESEFAMFSVNG
jgi:hypothetical protein